MTRKRSGRPVDFKPLPQLPLQLEHNADLCMLYSKINSIVAKVKAAESCKRKLRIITQTAAVHYACFKLALIIIQAEESKGSIHQQLWQKALVAVVERADDVCCSLYTMNNACLLTDKACQPAKPQGALQSLGKAGSAPNTPPRRASHTYGVNPSGNDTGNHRERHGERTMGVGSLDDNAEACPVRGTA